MKRSLTLENESDRFNEENSPRRISQPRGAHVESSLNFHSLNVDCWEEVFDYLSLADLHAMGRTCKRMHRIAGSHFQQTYAAAHVVCKSDGIYVRCIQINGFVQFIQNISFYTDDLLCFRYVQSNSLDSLKKIRFCSITLTDEKVACLQSILAKVEVVEIFCCTMNGEFYGNFLSKCPKLKRLTVKGFYGPGPLIGTANDWLLREYSQLEHLELTSMRVDYKIDELETFFHRNPHIRSFAIDSDSLWNNRNLIMTAHVKLDRLAIDSENVESDYFYRLLNELHAIGVYKKLQFYLLNIDERTINPIASFAAMDKLYSQLLDEDVVFPSLANLKELCIGCTMNITDMNALAKALVNLEQIQFLVANSNQIVPFVRHSTKLTKIKVKSLEEKTNREGNVLDLTAWNKQRAKLAGARKIVIYVEEDVYLATKWTLKDVDRSLIQLKRTESHESNHDFGNL